MKKILSLSLILFLALISINTYAQINEDEGLNMPGSWNGWNNPPTLNVFLSEKAGGQVKHVKELGISLYQTQIEVSATSTVQAGNYEFLFSSPAFGDAWGNKWGNVNFSPNAIETVVYQGDNNNSITLKNDKTYIVNFQDKGYEDTRAVFMELDNLPVSFTSVTQNPEIPLPENSVTINVTTDNAPSENCYLRYTDDDWQTSHIVEISFTGNAGTAQIPAMTAESEIEYYVFSTQFDNPNEDFDLITINFENNNSQNYTYTVAQEQNCENAAGVLTANPVFPIHDGNITLTFNAELGNGELMNYEGDVYAHTGLITSESEGNNDWQHVISDWNVNEAKFKFTKTGDNLYELNINNIRQFYNVPASEEIYKIAMVVRAETPIDPDNPDEYLVARNSDGTDMHLKVYNEGLNVKYEGRLNKDPLVPSNTLVPICIYSLDANEITLKIDGNTVSSTVSDNLMYSMSTGDYAPGIHKIIAEATDGTNTARDTVSFYIRGEVVVQELPAGMKYGINYTSDNNATLVFHEPSLDKEFIFVIGDFNDWIATDEGYMKRTPDGSIYWTEITGLTPGTEYAYQYYIDGKLRLADPYCDKILDPWNDRYIPETTYPNLKEYPWDKTIGTVSVLETGQTPYAWQVENFTPVALNETQSNLIIYELLVRDFSEEKTINAVSEKLDYLQNLGVNAIELMPFAEFDGNDSWGYAPNFLYAPDKAYGTKNDYKAFIDECHQRGIAVIMDVVYNHQYGGSPLVQLYWDEENEQPQANSAWFNTRATHPLSIGYDMNHESTHTRELVKDNLKYWINEYKIDGFRFDMSKGFTQNNTGEDINAWSQYDQSRIDIITDYYNHIKSINPSAYVILEHMANNDEEKVLANQGCLMWGVMSEQFQQAAMGADTNHDFSWASYIERGYTYPNLIPYPESHDEERIMYKLLNYGNGTQDNQTASLKKAEATAVMYMTIPGPKMIWQFGEYGYDESIFLCPDESFSENCRTSAKPLHWEYLENIDRQHLYNVYASMIELKTQNAAFREGTYTQDLSGLGKKMWIAHPDMNVVVSANFASTDFDMTPGFQHAGTWYNYFTGESFEVTDPAGHSIHYNSGDYFVFTDVPVEKPFINLTIKVKDSEDQVINAAKVSIPEYTETQTNSDGNAFLIVKSNAELQYTISATGYQTASGILNTSTVDMIEIVALSPVGVENIQEEGLKIYPNPMKKGFYLETKEKGLIQIYDLTGKSLKSQKINENEHYVDIQDIKPGIYLLKFDTGNEKIVKKIIIN